MMQDADEKAQAIASVLWLLPDHFSMIRIGRHGLHFVNELEQSDMPAGWKPRVPEEFEGWPIAEIKAWFAYQRKLSAKYRLWAVGLAMAKLEREHREQAMAVVMECVEDGIFTWYEPERVSDRCRAGLRFMAGDIPGDVPFFQEAVVSFKSRLNTVARNKRIVEMAEEGIGKKRIARELGCSVHTVKAVLCGLAVRRGRAVSAGGVDKGGTTC